MNEPVSLTHLDEAGRPRMVDIGDKQVTRRSAVAEAVVRFPATVAAELRRQDMRTAKGAIADTAIVAGVMAAKRTHELIPFCHPLPLERCKVALHWHDDVALAVTCEVAATHRTGVEMEALTGAGIAALTVYDMCKALSLDIAIDGVRLLAKHGGRRDFDRRRGTP
ncbi:MAG TPA: cyclic pyranopterin monophosphate synthase MoaC [Xanthomonadaceae bacterium]|nr:cyclic pyranopterin monophosphate synthase MoaC [Xanthomonadaceae bacterium]